ncbi:helix-turn-helix domain-containing protein [Streptomyces celluloflavus]|uniref:helix-turn-helix domain-containing protein n=1 Tax=Streptomyces celluloflavus TaxID=58344 RepID=UPI0036B8CE3D
MAEETAGFAALLRELKDRSGQSYGALAKRLHMSTSTLHRYCNGDAVPAEYAPVERLARLCRATPDELVALHRQWILADDARRRERERERERKQGSGAGAAAAAGAGAGAAAGAGAVEGAGAAAGVAAGVSAGPVVAPVAEPDAGAGDGAVRAAPVTPAAAPAAGEATGTGSAPVAEPVAVAVSAADGEAVVAGEPVAADEPGGSGPVAEIGAGQVPPAGAVRTGRRRRTALVAGIAVAAVAVSAAVAVGLTSGGDGGGRKAAADTAAGAAPGKEDTRAGGPAGASPSAGPTRTGSAGPSPSHSAGSDKATKGADGGRTKPPAADADPGSLPLNLFVRPYTWEDPCSQRYLVDKKPDDMVPPPPEADVRGWVSKLGAVSAGEQIIQVTVQGAGHETVVLNALRVQVVKRSEPLTWNAYGMGVGCGGGMTPKTFGVSLDAARPQVTPEGGQRGFPYKVSEKDPEVLKITARAGAHDVRWYLLLEWSSGGRHGTLPIDDNGEPFHTSALTGRPQFDYPLGGSNEWIPTPEDEG